MLKMSRQPRKLTIFEGPDGSGKTTLAKKFAEDTNALYVHFEAHENVEDIHKFFIEAMQPALLGYQDVVFDRCWHSGPIYDAFHRNLLPEEQRMSKEVLTLLDRAAAHCEAVTVICLPSEEICIHNWQNRIGAEMVKSQINMRGIYHAYYRLDEATTLPCISWDYMNQDANNLAASIKSERVHFYNDAHIDKVHIIVSTTKKSSCDMLIDIPGVSFDKTSDEYRMATAFSGDDDTCMPTESIIKFLSPDTDLVEYFSKDNFPHSKQVLIGVGATGCEAVDKFYDIYQSKDKKKSFVKNMDFYALGSLVGDNIIREYNGALTLNETIREAYIRIGSSDENTSYKRCEDEEQSCQEAKPDSDESTTIKVTYGEVPPELSEILGKILTAIKGGKKW